MIYLDKSIKEIDSMYESGLISYEDYCENMKFACNIVFENRKRHVDNMVMVTRAGMLIIGLCSAYGILLLLKHVWS